MAFFTPIVLQGSTSHPPSHITNKQIQQGKWHPYIPHNFKELTECPCGYLDRFSGHGRPIREAFEDGVVATIATFFTPNIVVAVVGSGGLLQEACWLTKFVYQNKNFVQISLHLIDTEYEQNFKSIHKLAEYADQILRKGTTLVIHAWKSCQDLQAATKKNRDFSPHLVIGMDTEHATGSLADYQWNLIPGDVEKALFIRWKIEGGQTYIEVYSRKGSDTALNCRQFHLTKFAEAKEYIKVAAVVG